MTKVKFYNGLRQIGGTFVEVETEKAKCMFDFGFGVMNRLDSKFHIKKEYRAADYVRLGMLPKADGIYKRDTAVELGVTPAKDMDKKCFFLISHMHIDHMEGLGVLQKDIPVYMSADSKRLYQVLGRQQKKKKVHKNCIGIKYGESFTIEDITVQVLAIDHDIIGASGFIITTPDGTICYTGDYRFHGFHPEYTEKFARMAKGADLLITEGVMASFEDIDMLALEKPKTDGPTEETRLEEFRELARNTNGLLVINPYNRNVERIHRLNEMLKEQGRILVMDDKQAGLLQEFYPQDEITVYEETVRSYGKEQLRENIGWKVITKEQIKCKPEEYVLQLDYTDMPELLSLSGVVKEYVHMDGSPLGDYDASYKTMQELLAFLNIPYTYMGTGGHARPYYLRYFIDTVAPDILVPLHTFRPEQVMSRNIRKRVLPEYGDCIELGK